MVARLLMGNQYLFSTSSNKEIIVRVEINNENFYAEVTGEIC
jgi:hypothetical protein